MNKEPYQLSRLVLLSAFLGLVAVPVAFVAASACETPGTTSLWEVSGMCIGTALYLGFCQFWLAVKGCRAWKAQCIILAVSIAPLVLAGVTWSPRRQGLLCLAAGCLASLLGAMIGRLVTSPRRLCLAEASSDADQ